MTTEAGSTQSFTVVLDSQPSANVTIGVVSDTGEGFVTSFVTFALGGWNVSQTLTVTGVDDVRVDGNIAYNITAGAASSSDTNFDGKFMGGTVGITNIDGMLTQSGC
jgi:hypothetical protein